MLTLITDDYSLGSAVLNVFGSTFLNCGLNCWCYYTPLHVWPICFGIL